VFLLVRRGLLVVFLGAKILGYADALNVWEGAVSRQTIVHGGIPVDVYRGRDTVSPILIVHGVNPTGKDSLDLVRVSEGLAQAGYEVYVPDLAEMKKQHLRPEEAASIKTVFQSIGRNAGIACFSYGCGPALIAAMDPEIRAQIRFVIDFGGYFDIRETLEFVVTGPETPLAYNKWVYLAANSDFAADETSRRRIREIAEKRLAGLPLEPGIDENLPADARSLLEVFSATNREDFRARLDAAPESLRQRLDALSPSRYVRQLHTPLMLIHGAYDPSIPAQQSIELAAAARANGIDYTLTLLQMYGHTNPTLPKVAFGSILGYYIPEVFRFLRIVNRVVAMR
jgi:pimeloyl-ACP methyl ester carboxylesterase